MFVETLTAFDLTPTDFWMILVGMVFFTVYWKVSEGVLFGPLLRLFEEREAATVGAQEGASGTLEEAARLESVYEQSLNEARREAVTERMKVLSTASSEASTVVSTAESQAKETTAKGRAELAQMEERLRGELEKSVDPLATELAAKILDGGASAQR